MDNWPSPSFTPQTLAATLQIIRAPQAVINQLAPADGAEGNLSDQSGLLEQFVTAAAMPEQRLKMAQAIGCVYEDLTNWAIRADLQRIGGVDAELAELLASVDVKGAHDFAACTEHPLRLGKLQDDLYQKINGSEGLDPLKRQALKRRLQQPELVRLGMNGRALPCYLVADVSVILVVKGAGLQRADETLDVFLDGFWPAVKSIDGRATISKRQDVFPPGYRSSAYDDAPLNQVTEIRSGERRIWVREPNWDAALVPANPLGALFKEWRMATYAFGRGLHDWFADPDTRKRKRNFWEFYRAFAVIYWLIFWHIGVTLAWGRESWNLWQASGSAQVLLQMLVILTLAAVIFALLTSLKTGYQVDIRRLRTLPGAADWVFILLVLAVLLSPGGYIMRLLFAGDTPTLGLLLATVTVAALLFALLPAVKANHQIKLYQEGYGRLEALPGVAGWVAILLMLAFLFSPGGYVLWLLFVVVVELALLLARAIAWPYREISNSDSLTDHYYSIKDDVDEKTGEPNIYKWSNKAPSGRHRRLFILIYRYLVVLSLPITFLGLALARVLQWTRVLGGLGDEIEKFMNLALSGVLGDVVSYAMDPAQAHRVRSVVESDLRFFHERAGVSLIHVFAHSQGTPITFETLFHHLPDAFRRKIKTYVTIGSVLSYYHQVNAVLDAFFIPRFPVFPYPKFADGFKWMNFWNLADPITEFYGLDEYNLVEKAPVLPLDGNGNPIPLSTKESLFATRRSPASPTNIKTRATLENHSEYWSNLDQVHIPFALRVLGLWRPRQWNPEKLKTVTFGLQHSTYVLLWWIIWAVLFLILFVLNVRAAVQLVDAAEPALRELANLIPAALQNLTESQGEGGRAVLTALASLAQTLVFRYSRELFAIIMLLAVPAIAALPLAGLGYLLALIGSVVARKPTASPEDRKLYVRRLYEETFTHRTEPIRNAPPVPGPLQSFFAAFHAAFSDACATVDDVTGEDNRLVAHLALSGLHHAEFHGIPPTGRQVITTATITHTFAKNGGIEQAVCEVDEGVLKEQLLD